MSNKNYDVVLLGATGFTGRLVAEYFFSKYGNGRSLKWAIAGRNENKLKEVIQDLKLGDIDYFLVDNLDKESLDLMTAQTKVVCTTVGPYAKFGTLVVESCIDNNTHYCDLCGEVQWMRKTIDNYHQKAIANKVKIVHSCGFDSIPSDMGVLFLQNEAKSTFGEYCSKIEMRLKAASGGMSGGTLASLENVLTEASKDKSIYKVLFDPYGLNPQNDRNGPDKPGIMKVQFDHENQEWLTPFLMETINSKIVRRSIALRNHPYGKDFSYDESMIAGKGFSGRIKAYTILLTLGMMRAKPGSLTRKLLSFFMPKAGEGPSKAKQENGFFYFIARGKTSSGKKIAAKIKGDKDPGYGSTSKMLGECAVALAHDNLPAAYGVLTPATGLGEKMMDRLTENAGLTFEMVTDNSLYAE
jgi:short subunit dehydrogenase-like uncharacterized protein